LAQYHLKLVGTDAAQALEVARWVTKGLSKTKDLCDIVTGICTGNKGLSRAEMPQIEGNKSTQALLDSKDPDEQAKGAAQVACGADVKDKRPILEQWLAHLKKQGIKQETHPVAVGLLKATQEEIQAAKTYEMAHNHLSGKFDDIDARILVSKDGYILDGHHRWAALLCISPERKIQATVLDLGMDALLEMAAKFPGIYAANLQGKPLNEAGQKKYKQTALSKKARVHVASEFWLRRVYMQG